MPDPQPISNRQRKILERQAERNREMAAAKRADTRTPFREAELQFLSRQPQPDFSLALDFRRPAEDLLKDSKIQRVQLGKKMAEFSDLFGMIYIPAAFSPAAQRTLVKACLKEYSRHPNKSNLDTHYNVPDCGVWDLHERVENGSLSLETDANKAFVPRKAKADEHANGYGSDDDDDDDEDNDREENKSREGPTEKPPTKKAKQSTTSSVRTLVPETNETPTVPEDVPKIDPEPSSQVPILPPAQLIRKMRWITLGYQYHWPSKTYHFDQNAPFPEELCVLSKAVVAAVESVAGPGSPWYYAAEEFVAEAGVVNYYQLKDRLMGHVDRSELNKDAPLVSFSFGHSCIYLLGGPTREKAPTPILLQSGDILVMTGPCRAAFHGVPRIIENTLPDYLQTRPDDPEWDIYAEYLSEARINLNIRQVYPPKKKQEEETTSSSPTSWVI
ncbi:hypothetical protein BGZ83_002585 [Gryganskiella cystojenkinii]|nr:hypothetical protein BGZ83_002585 [Gryganskiella cystojenkinii]